MYDNACSMLKRVQRREGCTTKYTAQNGVAKKTVEQMANEEMHAGWNSRHQNRWRDCIHGIAYVRILRGGVGQKQNNKKRERKKKKRGRRQHKTPHFLHFLRSMRSQLDQQRTHAS